MDKHIFERLVIFVALSINMLLLFFGTTAHIDKKTEEIKAEIRAAAKAGAPSAK